MKQTEFEKSVFAALAEATGQEAAALDNDKAFQLLRSIIDQTRKQMIVNQQQQVLIRAMRPFCDLLR